MNMYLTVVPEIVKQFFDSLRACKACFEFQSRSNVFRIFMIERIDYQSERENYGIVFKVLGNETTNEVFVQKDNVIQIDIYSVLP